MRTDRSDLYLGAIYHLQERGIAVTTSRLAEELDVSMASVSEMLRKLGKGGWVNYEPYQPVTLAEAGRRRAAKLVRRHRLWEVFMVEKLGMGWERVYREACALEHATSEVVMEALAEFLGHPVTGAHGYPIPDANGNVPVLSKGLPLIALKVGQRGQVLQVSARDPELLLYLKQINLVPGRVVEVLTKAPFDGPLTVRAGGAETHAIARQVAACVNVNLLKE